MQQVLTIPIMANRKHEGGQVVRIFSGTIEVKGTLHNYINVYHSSHSTGEWVKKKLVFLLGPSYFHDHVDYM